MEPFQVKLLKNIFPGLTECAILYYRRYPLYPYFLSPLCTSKNNVAKISAKVVCLYLVVDFADTVSTQ